MKPLLNKFTSVCATTLVAGGLSLGVAGSAVAQQATPTDNETQPLNLISGLKVGAKSDSAPASDTTAVAPGNAANVENVDNTAGAADNLSAAATDADTDASSVAPNTETKTETDKQTETETNAGIAANDAVADPATPAADDTGGLVLTLGKSSASDVGIAAIGVTGVPRAYSDLDALIWRGSSAAHARMILANGTARNASQVLTAIASDVVAQQSVPPGGTNLIVDEVVSTRLNWLAAAGRTKDLVAIVRQLPDEPAWNEWKKWLVQAQLMAMDDATACATVQKESAKTIDPFWHKAKVLCAIVDGNVIGARFAADILRDSGVDDPVFFALVEEMLNEIPAPPFDPATLTPMHVVMMDIVRHEIGIDALQALPQQMMQEAVTLRYLSDEARMVSTYDALALGLIDATAAGDLWRTIAGDTTTPESALARHLSKPTALTMAMAWRALDREKTGARLPLIAAMMQDSDDQQMRNHTAPLFAALAREGVAFAGAETTLNAKDATVTGRIALLLALDNPHTYDLPPSFPRPTYAENAAKLLRAIDEGAITATVLKAMDMWHLVPVLEASGVTLAEPDWIDVLNAPSSPAMAPNRTTISLSLPMLRALEQAASKRRVAETILLANWIIGDTPLAAIDPADAARVIAAIAELGQNRAADALALEFVRAHLWAGASEAALAAQSGAWILPQLPVDEQETAPTSDAGDGAETGDDTGEETGDEAGGDAGQDQAVIPDNASANDAGTNGSGTTDLGTTNPAQDNETASADESDGVTVDGDQTDQ